MNIEQRGEKLSGFLQLVMSRACPVFVEVEWRGLWFHLAKLQVTNWANKSKTFLNYKD